MTKVSGKKAPWLQTRSKGPPPHPAPPTPNTAVT